MRDCVVEDVTTNALVPSLLRGLPEAPMDGVSMRRIAIRAEAPRKVKPGSRPPALFAVGDHVRVAIDGLTVSWQGHEALWSGVASGPGLAVTPR